MLKQFWRVVSSCWRKPRQSQLLEHDGTWRWKTEYNGTLLAIYFEVESGQVTWPDSSPPCLLMAMFVGEPFERLQKNHEARQLLEFSTLTRVEPWVQAHVKVED